MKKSVVVKHLQQACQQQISLTPPKQKNINIIPKPIIRELYL
jgi:hypothetical protein